ncbi:winged helix DNA-binding domain-containing protein [Streptomyces sp. SCSIO 30461]|uniref:winged helix DNA-binding domain-containing protein n=1 Tax=Streptomyces sp. SCSIO 30461 TaxID=3118085 RepID=UPI00387E4D42
MISARELNRSTLSRQLLLERAPLTVLDGVRHVVALQAQHPASPYVALWNRLSGFDPAALDALFTARSVVKATLMRITLHAVHIDDYPVFRAAMQPTLHAARLGTRFTAGGLTPADANALLPELLAFTHRPRTATDMRTWLAERAAGEGVPDAVRAADSTWWGLKGYAPLHHVPMGGPWSFGPRPSFVAAGPEAPATDPEAARGSLPSLIVRYLSGFGPASVADIAQFALVKRPAIREALRTLDDAVEEFQGPDGATLFDLPGASRPPAETPAPARLMAMWDSVLLAYADRSRVIPPAYRPLVIRRNGDVLPTLLVDGYVAGVWRQVDTGIEATAFHTLPDATWDRLSAEARSLTALLADRDPAVYGRYHHWWAGLPEAETRLL